MSSNLKRGSSSFGDVGCAGQWSEGGDVNKDQGAFPSASQGTKPAPLFGGVPSRSDAASSSQLQSKSSSSTDNAAVSHPAAKKTKLAPSALKNPFEVLCSPAEDSNTSEGKQASGSFKAVSFLKPSKLEWGASSVFKTVQSNSLPLASKPDSNSFSSQFLNLTRAPSCGTGNLNPAIGGEINGKNSNHGDSKNAISSPTKVEESAALTSEEAHASSTSTGERSSKMGISDSLFGANSASTSTAFSSVNESGGSSNDTSKLFMFGQNLQDRVVVPTGAESSKVESSESAKVAETSSAEPKKTVAGGDLKPTPVFAGSSNESPLIFKEAGEKTERKGDNVFSTTVQMQTGEENEITVLQIQARLFQYDSSVKNWRERGRGVLRLNESKFAGNGKANDVQNSARILMRTHATYQLVLNTKLFADQLLEKASDKAVKLSCFNEENTGMALYTIKGSAADIDALFVHLKERIDRLKQKSTQENEPSSDEDQTRLENKKQPERSATVDEKKEEPQTNSSTNLGTDETSSGADSYYRSTTPSGHSLDENSRNTSPPLSSSEETNF